MFHSRTFRWIGATLALLACALDSAVYAVNCCPQIDPTGRRIFVWPDCPLKSPSTVPPPPTAGTGVAAPQPARKEQQSLYLNNPGIHWPSYDQSIFVSPGKIIAPVGSEVVVQAGVCHKNGHLMANQPVEWTIAPGSVGHFLDYGRKAPRDYLLAPFQPHEKRSPTEVHNATSSWYVRLNRGTPTTTDDVYNMRGQAWATVTSPLEGTTYVTAYSREVYEWNLRKQTATIYWIDAQWVLPPPAVNPAGSRHTFTTTVSRQSNQAPLPNWIVRYELTGGPPAGFAPNGAQAIEVSTNSLGQASAELFQQQPTPGTNTVSVQIIRPGDMPGGDGTRIVVGQGQTQKTWSSAGLSIDKSGPPEAAIGATITYQIVVQNPGDLPARDVIVADQLSQGLTFVSANPPASLGQGVVQWQLGTLAPREGRRIEVNFRADQPGTLNNCATVRSSDGTTATDCATTRVQSPTVDVSMIGPNDAVVGQDVTFQIVVANRGSYPVSGLTLIDRFDPGLQHRALPSPIENRELGTIEPGQSRAINVTLRVVEPGRWCNSVEVYGDGALKGAAQACVYAVATATPPGTVPPPGTVVPPAATGRPALRVTASTVQRATVGDAVVVVVNVQNIGQGPATNVRIATGSDVVLRARSASPNHQSAGNELFWTIDALPPGGSEERRIEYLCDASAQRACSRTVVTCNEGVRGDAEACLEIAGPPQPLSMTVADLTDPVGVGREVGYEIRVTNFSGQPDRNVVLTVTLPPEIAPLPLSTSGPSQLRFNVTGQVIQFFPVAELRAGENISYRIRGTARAPGDVRMQASLTSANAPSPITAEERTTIFAE